MGRLYLRGEVERDGDFFAKTFILDRDRVQVVLAGLSGVADAQAGRRDRGAVIGDLAAVLAAGLEVRRGLARPAATQGAQLGVVLGLDLQCGRREGVGLLLVVAGFLPGVGGDLSELDDLVGGERLHGVEVAAVVGDVLGTERERDIGRRIAEGRRARCEFLVDRGEHLQGGAERVQARRRRGIGSEAGVAARRSRHAWRSPRGRIAARASAGFLPARCAQAAHWAVVSAKSAASCSGARWACAVGWSV